MTNTKILSEKTLFTSQYFDIEEITLQRNGKTFVKEFAKRRPIVLVLAINKNDEVYLVSQYREILKKETLELVAGHCDGREPLVAAKSELEEEAGVTAKKWRELTILDQSANILQKIHVFLATGLTEKQAHPDDDEDLRAIKIPFKEAVSKALSGEITIAANIAVILLFDKLRQEGKLY